MTLVLEITFYEGACESICMQGACEYAVERILFPISYLAQKCIGGFTAFVFYVNEISLNIDNIHSISSVNKTTLISVQRKNSFGNARPGSLH